MNFDIIITRLNELTNRFNQLVNNSKRIPELPTATNGNKKIAAYNESNQLVEQFDLTAALQGFETLDDGVKALGSITKDENEFTFGIGFQWKINGINYANTEVKVREIDPAEDGFFRIDIAVVDTNNNIIIIQGIESNTVAVQPLPPPNTLLLIPFSINGATVVEGDLTPIGTQFVKKEEYGVFPCIIGEDVTGYAIPLQDAGQKYYTISSLSEDLPIRGFTPDIIDEASDNMPYPGKLFYLENIGTEQCVLLHNDNTYNGVLFEFFDTGDFTLKPNQVIIFRYSPISDNGYGKMQFMYAPENVSNKVNNLDNPSSTTYPSTEAVATQKIITISSSRSLTNADHNSIIRITATCTITVPTGLRSDFFVKKFDTISGVVLNLISANGVVLDAPNGTYLQPNKQASLYAYSQNNFRLVGETSLLNEFFVRPAGTTYGDSSGTSYENAWSGFSNIDWNAVQNNTLNVCGTHFESLVVANNNVYIKGNNPIESGIIDGQNTRVTNIDVNNWQNVYFDGIQSYRATQDCIFIRGTAIVTTKDCVFSESGNQGIQHYNFATGYHYNALAENNVDDGVSAHDNATFYLYGGSFNNNGEGINIIKDTRAYVYNVSFSSNVNQDIRVISANASEQCILEVYDSTINIADVSTNAKLILNNCNVTNLKAGAGIVRSFVEATNCIITASTNSNLVDLTFTNCRITNLIKPNTSATNVIRLYNSYCRIQGTFNYTGILIARRTLFSGLGSTQITLDMVSGSTTDIAYCVFTETAATRFAMTFRAGANITRFDNVTFANNGVGNGLFSLVAHTFNNLIFFQCVTGMQASGVTLVAQNCCFNSNTTNTISTVTQINSQTTSPNFVDVSQKDYRLGAGSSCIGTGITLVENIGIETANFATGLPNVVEKEQNTNWNIGAYV